jgi:hypothetical protein
MVIQTNQAVMQAAITSDGVPATSQAVMQAATVETTTGAKTSHVAMLVSFAPPGTRNVRTSEAVMLTGTAADPAPAQTSMAAMLVAYRTGSIENLKVRAWTYSLDGHTFYVLTLGEQGTFVYDESTQQWAKWQTAGLSGWNMEIGTVWKGRIIAADQAEPTLWELDPLSFIDDDFKPQTRVVTGALSMRNRAMIPNYAFRITASLADVDVPLTLPETEPTITLEISDDQGKTFQSMGSIVLDLNDPKQELAWLSLGTMEPPMRVFKVTDLGAVARIDGGDAEVGEEGS